jgi:hypothetical protein
MKTLKIKLYRTVTLLLFYVGVKLKFLTLREEHRLRVLENKVLRRIFGPKREVIGLRELLNEDPHHFYSLPNIIRVIKLKMMRWQGM